MKDFGENDWHQGSCEGRSTRPYDADFVSCRTHSSLLWGDLVKGRSRHVVGGPFIQNPLSWCPSSSGTTAVSVPITFGKEKWFEVCVPGHCLPFTLVAKWGDHV